MAHSDADLDALALRVAQTLLASGRTLVTAESCSGGWIGKVCTDIPGSSAWFRGGAIVYDNALKVAMLGVPAEVLASDGAVSEPAVRQMARGVLELLGGDFSLAVSGIAGPDGGTPEKPVGTVWFAWGARGPDGMSVRAEVRHLPGDREAVRRATVAIALQGLIEA